MDKDEFILICVKIKLYGNYESLKKSCIKITEVIYNVESSRKPWRQPYLIVLAPLTLTLLSNYWQYMIEIRLILSCLLCPYILSMCIIPQVP